MEIVYKQLYDKQKNRIGYRETLTFKYMVEDSKITIAENQYKTLDLTLKYVKNSFDSIYIKDYGNVSVSELFKNKYILQNLFFTLNFEDETFKTEALAEIDYFRVISSKVQEFREYLVIELQLIDDFNWLLGRYTADKAINGTFNTAYLITNILKVNTDLNREYRMYQPVFLNSSDLEKASVEEFGTGNFKEILIDILDKTNTYLKDVTIDYTFSNFKYQIDKKNNNSDYSNTFYVDFTENKGADNYINYFNTTIDLSEAGTSGKIEFQDGKTYIVNSDEVVVDGFKATDFLYDVTEIETLNDDRFTILSNAKEEQLKRIKESTKEEYEIPDFYFKNQYLDNIEKLMNYYKIKLYNYIQITTDTDVLIFRILEVSGQVGEQIINNVKTDVMTKKVLKTELVSKKRRDY